MAAAAFPLGKAASGPALAVAGSAAGAPGAAAMPDAGVDAVDVTSGAAGFFGLMAPMIVLPMNTNRITSTEMIPAAFMRSAGLSVAKLMRVSPPSRPRTK